jgi:hypothetical protein
MSETGEEPAAARLDRTVAAFIDTIRELPEDAVAAQGWGPREKLAHIVYAHELYVSYLRAAAHNEPPPLFEGTYHEQNRLAVESLGRAPVSGLLERLRTAQSKLMLLGEGPGISDRPFYFKRGAKARSYAEALTEIDGHIRGHLREIRSERRRREQGWPVGRG